MDRSSLSVLSAEPLNAETSWEALREPLTPPAAFFKRNHFAVPDLDPQGWELVVDGGAQQPLRLRLDDLADFPVRTVEATLECAGNGRSLLDPTPGGTPWTLRAVSTARWTGVPVVDVLDRAGVPPGTVEVVFEGADGDGAATGPYARSLPLEVAAAPQVLLARQMNGRPLPTEHGGPLRLLVPGWYGMASVKWLRRIMFLDRPFDGFFQTQDYVVRPRAAAPRPVTRTRPRALVVQPRDGATVGSPVTLSGWAWSGTGPVVRVEVAAGDGPARQAELEPDRGAFTWRRWQARLALPPGRHRVGVRATDVHGNTQPDQAVWNPGGYENTTPQPIRLHVTG